MRQTEFTMKGFFRGALFLMLLAWMPLSGQENAQQLYSHGIRLFYDKDYAAAAELFGECLEQNPDFHMAHYNRGKAWMALRKWKEAAADMDRLLAADSLFLDAYLLRGRALSRMGRHELSLADLQAGLEISPNHPEFLNELAQEYYYIRDYDQASGTLAKLIEEDSTDPSNYYRLGLIHYDQDHYENAVAQFSKAIQFDEDHLQALEMRGSSFLRKNEIEKACEDWQRAMNLGSGNVEADVIRYCGK